jgi:hypothetical protein
VSGSQLSVAMTGQRDGSSNSLSLPADTREAPTATQAWVCRRSAPHPHHAQTALALQTAMCPRRALLAPTSTQTSHAASCTAAHQTHTNVGQQLSRVLTHRNSLEQGVHTGPQPAPWLDTSAPLLRADVLVCYVSLRATPAQLCVSLSAGKNRRENAWARTATGLLLGPWRQSGCEHTRRE